MGIEKKRQKEREKIREDVVYTTYHSTSYIQ